MKSRFLLAVLAAFSFTLAAGAATITIGTGSVANCYPFACGGAGGVTWYQQQYRAGSFGSSDPILISSITFFGEESTIGLGSDSGTFDIYLATSATEFGAATSDFDANLGPDLTLFASVSFGPTMPASFTITGIAPFLYDPTAGDLVMDIRVTGWTTSIGYNSFFLAAEDSPDILRSWQSGESYLNQGFALVTQFGYEDGGGSAVPEPGSLLLAAAGLGALFLRLRARRTL